MTLLITKNELGSFDIVLVDCVKQGISQLNVVLQQQLNELNVIIFDGNQQGRSAKCVDTVDVDGVVHLSVKMPPRHEVSNVTEHDQQKTEEKKICLENIKISRNRR